MFGRSLFDSFFNDDFFQDPFAFHNQIHEQMMRQHQQMAAQMHHMMSGFRGPMQPMHPLGFEPISPLGLLQQQQQQPFQQHQQHQQQSLPQHHSTVSVEEVSDDESEPTHTVRARVDEPDSPSNRPQRRTIPIQFNDNNNVSPMTSVSFSSYSSSSSNGQPPVIRTSSRQIVNMNGVTEMKAHAYDSTTNQETLAMRRQIGDVGREIVRTKNLTTGQEKKNQKAINLQPEQFSEFDQEVRRRVGLNPNNRVGLNSPQLALPSASQPAPQQAPRAQRLSPNSQTRTQQASPHQPYSQFRQQQVPQQQQSCSSGSRTQSQYQFQQ